MFAAAFAFGIWLCQQQAALVPVWLAGLALLMAGATCVYAFRQPSARPLSYALPLLAIVIGFAFASIRAHWRLSDALSPERQGPDVVVTGHIEGLVQWHGDDARFVFVTDDKARGVPRRLALSWYGRRFGGEAVPALGPGQRWQLNVRLRRPHGNANPSGFDYEAWLFQRKIRATGYVRADPLTRQLDGRAPNLSARIDDVRDGVRARVFATLPEKPIAALVAALTIGDQNGVEQAHWRLFAATGTTHLMAISGLHVTLVAGLIAWCVQGVWRRIPTLVLLCPAQRVFALAAAVAACAYVALAGFGVPAQRTLYMLAGAALALCLGREAEAGRAWLGALLLVLVIDPWAVLSAGFWLSFGAVGALLVLGLSQRGRGGLSGWLRAQGAITLLTLPMLVGVFGQFSVISPVANALAIPVVSFLITPLALLFAVLPWPPLGVLLTLSLKALLAALEYLAALPGAVWQQATPPTLLIVLGVTVAIWAILPRGFPGRRIGLLACVPLLAWSPARPDHGALRVTVLDVGQGLAVHVQTARHDLIYDTGPAFGAESDAGQRLVMPYLRSQGVVELDGLVLSHGDMDHAGGLRSLLDEMPVAWWAATEDVQAKTARSLRRITCHAGLAWRWDGVAFALLHPPAEESHGGKRNDRSCVLQVISEHGSVLLPGDVEASGEQRLIDVQGVALKSDVLVVPHHGSRTSSRSAFVRHVAPELVVFPVGHRNRFGHPHATVLARYTASGAEVARTDHDGAVSIEMSAAGRSVTRWRHRMARYWHHH
ncbi:MAG: DNA internalization-related competence protein ComEC/Rec2 [Rhodocyclaceae bacterium]